MEFSRYSYREKMQQLCSCSWKTSRSTISCCGHHLLNKTNALFAYLIYFISLSCVGFGILKALKPRTESFTPTNIDMFYTAVSAATVSSMSVVEMEVFSNAQLLVMTVLMLVGGEIFTFMARLHLFTRKKSHSTSSKTQPDIIVDHIELSIVAVPRDSGPRPFDQQPNNSFLKYESIRFLSYVVLGYLLMVQILGFASVLIYLAVVSSAEKVLRNKGIKTSTFAVFTVVSTFSSCGFVPTNENMVVFSKNSGLLLILIPQVLLGNTLFPCCLRLVLWVFGRRFNKKEAEYLLKSSDKQAVYNQHLLPSLHSRLLAATVFGFLLIGFVLFSSLDWNTPALAGLNTYQKVAGIVFECANARHSGETIVDLSTISPAILVFFVVMMYLPPYTSFLPIDKDEERPWNFEREGNRVVDNIVFSQLSYLAIFIVLICITERKSLKQDPLNFTLLNITLEVISAYGNVGFTTGYSCDRQLIKDPKCVSKWYGFSGKWSDEGKIILILVMFFGRLKQFNMKGGRAWKLL